MAPKDSRNKDSKPPNKGGIEKRDVALNSAAMKASGLGIKKQQATTSTTAEDITTTEIKNKVESSEVLGNRRFGRSPFQAHLLLEVGSFQLNLLDDYLVEVSKGREFHRDDTDRPKYCMSA